MVNRDWIGSHRPDIKDLTACILAGGLGTRLRSILPDTPKAMASVAGSPFLHYLLAKLATSGIGRTVICTGHLAGQIRDGLGSRFQGMEVLYSEENEPRGTAGAIRLALPLLDGGRVLVLNGDSYCDFDLPSLLEIHSARQASGSLVLAEVGDCARFGTVTLGPDGGVASFLEKRASSGRGWINAGVYLLERGLLEAIPYGREVSLEREVFPGLVGRGLYGFRMESGGFIDIGTPDSYALAQKFFAGRGPT